MKEQENNVSRCRCNKNYGMNINSNLNTYVQNFPLLKYISNWNVNFFKFCYIRVLNFCKYSEEFERINLFFFISGFFLLIFENNLKISTVIYYL